MTERALTGFAAAPGLAAGPVALLSVRLPADLGPTRPEDRRRQLEQASRALSDVALELEALAKQLRADGRSEEADIIESGAMMAYDPGLTRAIERLVLDAGRPAPTALLAACDAAAAELAALADPMLAERADDVRSLGRRAAAAAAGISRRDGGGVLVAPSLGPADVAELRSEVRAIALAGGGVTAHAAIVARSLGVPMVVGLGAEVLKVKDGETVVVDGDAGRLVRNPGPALLGRALDDGATRRQARERAIAQQLIPSITQDGRRIKVLGNASSSTEVREALAQGAEGIGLLRTELLFLDAASWPDEERHHRFLAPLLAQLAGRVATIRLLDFGGDKTPPFLAGETARGIDLMLRTPAALRAQMAAILRAARGVNLRILIPMVTSTEQIEAVRRTLAELVGAGPVPALGAMIETPEAALAAGDLAARLDFISVGTNDLTQLALGLNRESSGTSPVRHPAVFGLVANAVRAGSAAAIPVEVCGEAASDPLTIPLLVGLGTDELSVGAARVGEIRELVRGLDHATCRELAESALLDQAGDAGGQSV